MIDRIQIPVPVGFAVNLTLPDNNNTPAKTLQFLCHTCISFLVALYLCLPEVYVASRHPETGTALMPVPETAVDKYNSPVFRKDHVRMAWQALVILPVPETLAEQVLTDKNLRFGVFSVYLRHVVMALFWCEFIHLFEWYTQWFFRQTIHVLSAGFKSNRKNPEKLHSS